MIMKSLCRRTALAVALVAVLVALLVSSPISVEAKQCRTLRNNAVWKHSKGMFRRRPSSSSSSANNNRNAGASAETAAQWLEYNEKGEHVATFTEVVRASRQTVMADKERGVQVLLQGEVCAIKQDEEEQFRQLYQGSFVRLIDCT